MPGGYKGSIGASGTAVNYTNYNGYVLYFSDHRGMLPSTHPSNGGQTAANVINGESGIEDVVNSSQNLTSTTTDGVAEALSYYGYSPEDVDQNGFLDNWGEKNIGYGFGINTNTAPFNPYKRINVRRRGHGCLRRLCQLQHLHPGATSYRQSPIRKAWPIQSAVRATC